MAYIKDCGWYYLSCISEHFLHENSVNQIDWLNFHQEMCQFKGLLTRNQWIGRKLKVGQTETKSRTSDSQIKSRPEASNLTHCPTSRPIWQHWWWPILEGLWDRVIFRHHWTENDQLQLGFAGCRFFLPIFFSSRIPCLDFLIQNSEKCNAFMPLNQGIYLSYIFLALNSGSIILADFSCTYLVFFKYLCYFAKADDFVLGSSDPKLGWDEGRLSDSGVQIAWKVIRL